MGLLLILLFIVGLLVAVAMGTTADSRDSGAWYPAGPDREANRDTKVHAVREGIAVLHPALPEKY